MRQETILVTGDTSAALVVAGGASTYAQTTTDKMKNAAEDAKTGMSDTWITSKTKIALFADDRVKGSQVHVETQNGTVMLRGKVDDTQAKSSAEEITKGIEGVKGVKNELQVVAPGDRKAVNADDKQISKSIEDRFKQD